MEPLKVELTHIYDPILFPDKLRLHDGDIFGPDYDIKTREGFKAFDGKEINTTFTDPWWQKRVPVEKYTSISARQFEIYCKDKPVNLFIERNITNFDPATKTGKKNLEAFEFAGIAPKESWHYIFIPPEEYKQWRLYKHYFHSVSRGPNPEVLTVFNYDICNTVKDLTSNIPEAREKRVLL